MTRYFVSLSSWDGPGTVDDANKKLERKKLPNRARMNCSSVLVEADDKEQAYALRDELADLPKIIGISVLIDDLDKGP